MLSTIYALISAYNHSKGHDALSLNVTVGSQMHTLTPAPKHMNITFVSYPTIDASAPAMPPVEIQEPIQELFVEKAIEPYVEPLISSTCGSLSLSEQCERLVDFLIHDCDFCSNYEISTKTLREEFTKISHISFARHAQFQKLVDFVMIQHRQFSSITRINSRIYGGLRLKPIQDPKGASAPPEHSICPILQQDLPHLQ